jgi:uncharacterized membrane protein
MKISFLMNFLRMKLSLHMVEGFFKRELAIGPIKVCMATLLVLMEIIAYTIAFSILTIVKHYSFRTYAWDLGIFMQVLYTTAFKGALLRYNVELHTNPSGSFFGVHFSPILFFLVPLYRIVPRAETLLVLQSLVIGLGALPTYRIASLTLGSSFAGVAFATIYLLYTPLHSTNWFDFHVEAFFPLFYLYTFYYLITKKYWKALAFMLLGLSTIEFAPILYLGLASYTLIATFLHKRVVRREVLLYTFMVALSMVWFVLAIKVIEFFNPLKAGGAVNIGPWSHFGSSLQEIALSVFTQPLDALMFMITNDALSKANYLHFIFVPVLFLSILTPLKLVLLVGSWLIPAFLSSYAGYYGAGQYPALVAAQVFISAIYGLRRLAGNSSQVISKFLVMCLLINIVITSILSPLGLGAYVWWFAKPIPDIHTESLAYVVDVVKKKINDNESILVQNHVFPYFAHHLAAYPTLIPGITGAPILGNKGRELPWGKTIAWKIENVDYIIIDRRSEIWGIPLIASNEYKPMLALDWIVVLCKGCEGELESLDIESGHGLLAEIYNEPPWNFSPGSKPVLSMIVYTLDLDMGPWPPIPIVGKISHSIGQVGEWCVRFKGWLYAPEDGIYEFSLRSDDGSTLLVDNTTVIDGFGGGSMEKRGSIYLIKSWHHLEVLWGQGYGHARFSLMWKPPSARDFTKIPHEYLKWRVESG